MKLERITYRIRVVVAYLLFFAGFLHLLKALRLRRKAVVLMYHRVLSREMWETTFSHEGIMVAREIFERQIKYFKRCFNVVGLEEFAKRLASGERFEKYTCLITFDDGWKDNYTSAFPVLKEHGIPATIFLSTDYIGRNQGFWQERLSGMLSGIHRQKMKKDFRYKELLDKYNLQSVLDLPEDRLKSSVSEIVGGMKQHESEYIAEMVAEFSKDCQAGNAEVENCDVFLDWREIEIMEKDGITFGSHGLSHRILTRVNVLEAEREILESKEVIDRRLGKEVLAMSYPNGNYNASIVALAQKSGYGLAFGTERGLVGIGDHPYTLRRVNVHGDMTSNVPMLLCRILGVF
jgi:peptidoglycan/xylan/chitin deacetylase (PgdA/CDA1 family)